MTPLATLDVEAAANAGIASQLDYANQYVSFLVDGQLLGIPVSSVHEVLASQAICAFRWPARRSPGC